MQEAHGLVPDTVLETLENDLNYKVLSPIQKEVCAHLKQDK